MEWKKMSFWDILAWIVLGLITLWLILKVMGVINTPLWLEYAPLFGAVYLAGRAMNILHRTAQDLRETKHEVRFLEKELKQDMKKLETELRQDIQKLDLEIGIIKSRV